VSVVVSLPDWELPRELISLALEAGDGDVALGSSFPPTPIPSVEHDVPDLVPDGVCRPLGREVAPYQDGAASDDGVETLGEWRGMDTES